MTNIGNVPLVTAPISQLNHLFIELQKTKQMRLVITVLQWFLCMIIFDKQIS